jgi:hypothetical protein
MPNSIRGVNGRRQAATKAATPKGNGIRTADVHGGREHDACISSMPVPDCRRLGGLPRIEISQSLEGQDSLVVGKNAGNFAESALSCEHPSRKHQLIQMIADEFPTRTEQGIFLPAGN